MDNCPTCERKLETILDFPSVVLKAVEVRKIPQNVRLIERVFYIEKKAGMQNPALPKAVEDLFSGKPHEFTGPVEYEGWRWEREWRPSPPLRHEEFGSDAFWYRRTMPLDRLLKPHIKQLKNFIGKETPRAALAEVFDAILIPRNDKPPKLPAGYPNYDNKLNLSEGRLEFAYLPSKATINLVTYVSHGFGTRVPPPTESNRVPVLVLEYEGRLNQQIRPSHPAEVLNL